MKLNKMLKTTGLLILLVISSTCTAFAGEIEITPEHDCVYQQEYDDTGHWNECIICGAISDKVEHNLDAIYSHGVADSCCVDANNIKMYKCNDCEFNGEEELLRTKECVPDYDYTVFDYKTGYVVVYCDMCGSEYQYSKNEPFKDRNGNTITKLYESNLPIYLIDKYGNEIYVDRVYKKRVSYGGATDSNGKKIDTLDVVFDENNEYATFSGVCNIYHKLLELNPKEVRLLLDFDGIIDGSFSSGTFYHKDTFVVPDTLTRVGNKFIFEHTVKLRNAYSKPNKPEYNEYGIVRMITDGILNNNANYEVVARYINDLVIEDDYKYEIKQIHGNPIITSQNSSVED